MNIFRYSCEERGFILIDGRNIDASRFRKPSTARMLCAVNEAEAVIVLENEAGVDFKVTGWAAGAGAPAGLAAGMNGAGAQAGLAVGAEMNGAGALAGLAVGAEMNGAGAQAGLAVGAEMNSAGAQAGLAVGAEMNSAGAQAGLAAAVAFADLLGLKPRGGAFTYGTADPSKTFSFRAADGTHRAEVLTHFGESKFISLDGAPGLETICEGEL